MDLDKMLIDQLRQQSRETGRLQEQLRTVTVMRNFCQTYPEYKDAIWQFAQELFPKDLMPEINKELD